MQIKFLLLIVVLLFFFSIKRTYAQVQNINEEGPPLSLSLSTLYVDDVNPTTIQEISAYGVGLTSNGQLVTGGEGVKFLIDYDANIEGFKLSKNNLSFEDRQHFYDFKIRLLSRFIITKRWHFDTEIRRLDEVQKFGEGISKSRNDIWEADKLQQYSGAFTLVYGDDTSSRFVSLKVFANDDAYEKNNDYSSLFDLTQQGTELNIAFRQSSITSLLFRLSAMSDNYDSIAREDSDVLRASLGMKWQPTGKSKLEALLGMYWRTYSVQSSTSGLSWLFNYSIKPTESWLFKISSSRFSDTSKREFTSDSVKQNIGVDLSYDYSEQWKIGFKGKVEKTQFNQLGQTIELDEEQSSFYVSLKQKAHNEVSLIWKLSNKSISDQSTDYQQSEVRLTWQLDF